MEHHANDDGLKVLPSFQALVVKTIVTHTVTYFVFGVLALFVLDYAPVRRDRSTVPDAADH